MKIVLANTYKNSHFNKPGDI